MGLPIISDSDTTKKSDKINHFDVKKKPLSSMIRIFFLCIAINVRREYCENQILKRWMASWKTVKSSISHHQTFDGKIPKQRRNTKSSCSWVVGQTLFSSVSWRIENLAFTHVHTIFPNFLRRNSTYHFFVISLTKQIKEG